MLCHKWHIRMIKRFKTLSEINQKLIAWMSRSFYKSFFGKVIGRLLAEFEIINAFIFYVSLILNEYTKLLTTK